MKKTTRMLATMMVGWMVIVADTMAGESIGLNFSVAGNVETELKPDDGAGADGVAQKNWNNLAGASGKNNDIKDKSGRKVPGVKAEWSVPEGDTVWRSKPAEDWGFSGSNLKLQKGFIQLGAALEVSGIPHSKYDVYVYFGAGDNGGKGSVSISSPNGGVDPNGTYYCKHDWQGGKFVKSLATTKEAATGSNYVVFAGNTARRFKLDWKGDVEGGWIGVTGVQIVAVP